MAPRLDLRQSQSLVMTPQLQQAIKLLAMSNLELDAFVEGELERNPLLEREPAEGETPADAAPDSADETPASVEADAYADGALGEDVAARLSDSPSDLGDLGELGAGAGAAGAGCATDSEGFDFDRVEGAGATLAEHLLEQAGQALSGGRLMIATALIAHLDEAGYLRERPTTLASQLGVALDEVEAVLGVVQTFDPTGVGARDLAECLAIQAREADRYDPAMAKLIGHLDLVARGALGQLRRVCGVDEEDLADMLRELRGYDPKPGCRIGVGRIEAVVPDLFVRRGPDGWRVELNAQTLPRVLVNRDYATGVAGREAAPVKAWLGEQLAGATWLTRALDQRQRTILKVATELVRVQQGFFEQGVGALTALTLRQVADAVGLHESTVSRVTSNKYLSCARGTFELRYFFSSGIATEGQDSAMSAAAVKARIKTLIDREEAILSDDAIAGLLKAEGLDIARRTVVKYREAMGIGSSIQRRRARAIGRG